MVPIPLDGTVANALEEFRECFKQDHIHHVGVAPGLSENRNASVHSFTPAYPPRDFPDFWTARRWFEGRNVAFVRQQLQTGTNRFILAPMIDMRLTVAYHATACKNWPNIQRKGLLTGDPAQGRASTAGRFDCFGYFFVCPDLGTPADLGRQFTFTAHWWRGELADKSKTDPNREWMVLGINVGNLTGLRCFRDLFSESGVTLSGLDAIPADRISVAWEPANHD